MSRKRLQRWKTEERGAKEPRRPRPPAPDKPFMPKRNNSCRCFTFKGNAGPCGFFIEGASGRCVYCAHELECH